MNSLTPHYSKVKETFFQLHQIALRKKLAYNLGVHDHLIVVPVLIETEEKSGFFEDGYHISIFKNSWDGQIQINGVWVGDHSLHITDEQRQRKHPKRSLYYKAVPFLESVQNSSLSTLTIPWHPRNDIEMVLFQILGVKWRLEEIPTNDTNQ
jgi:hypothetical protein